MKMRFYGTREGTCIYRTTFSNTVKRCTHIEDIIGEETHTMFITVVYLKTIFEMDNNGI